MKASQSVHFDEHLDSAVVPEQHLKQRDRIATEATKTNKEALVESEESVAAGVISKDEFKRLSVDDVELYVVGYSHGILSHTEYEVQISVKNKLFYMKNTRFRHLEAFD